MSGPRPTAILVAGMHRSGTSATAGALGLMGVALGQNLLQPGADNPKGYWEHEQAVRIHERLLHALGREWDDVRALPADWERSNAARLAVNEIGRLVEDDFADAPMWAIKDPRICRLLPLWLEELPRHDISPVVLVVARRPDEVAASIHERNGWDRPLGVLLWLRHVFETEAASRDAPRTAITYDALLADPARHMSAALERLGLKPMQGEQALQGFVDAGERHHAYGHVKRRNNGFSAIADKVYMALSRIAAGDNAWPEIQVQAAAFEAEWERYGSYIDAVAAMAGRYGSEAETSRVEAVDLRSRLAAQLQWSEAAIRTQEAMQAERDRLRSELTAQVQWSEDAVKTHAAVQAERDQLRSDLAAQVQWSEDAVKTHMAVQAERDQLRSDLAAQVQWSEDAVKTHAAVRAERDQLRSDLAAQVQWSEDAVKRHEAVRAERDQLRSDLAAQVQWSEDAVKTHAAVQAERDQLRSDLAAQVQWSEDAVKTHAAVQAERDQLRSDLAAQVRWSEEAVRAHEAVQAERDSLRSDLAAQIRRSEEAIKAHGVMEAERDRLQSQLTAQMRSSQDAAKTHETVRAERDSLRSELVAQVRCSEEAVRRHEALWAENEQVRAELARVEAARDALRTELDLESTVRANVEERLAEAQRSYAEVLASSSWRLTRPLRTISAHLRRRSPPG